MGTFTKITCADVAEILGAYDLGAVASVEPLAAGTINTNLLVTTDRAKTFVRVNEGKSEGDVAYEAGLVTVLARRGVPTPPPHRARSGDPYVSFRDKHVTIFPWIEGRHLEPNEVGPEDVRKVGHALGRLHLAGADFSDRRDGIYTLEGIRGRFGTFESLGDPVLDPAVPILREELARLALERTSELPSGIIHQDLFRDNVLYAESRELVALLDFEQAVWGRWAYDLAVCLCAWTFEQGAFVPALVRALVEGYESQRPLEDLERSALELETHVAAVRFTITRITDIYLGPPGKPSGKDWRSYFARVQALRQGPLPL